MTKEDLKNNIGDSIKNNPSPKIRGNVLRDLMYNIIDECYPTENIDIKRFPKDASLTEDHIGLLAMQQVTFLNDPPIVHEDFEIKAVLSNTTPGVPGVKPVYELEIANIVFPQPVTQILRITFAENPDDGSNISFTTSEQNNLIYFISNVSQPNHIQKGSTLSDTIANFITFINSGYYPDITVHSTDNSTYIDFEIYQNESNEYTKYFDVCDIYFYSFTITPTTSIIRSLTDSNIVGKLNGISNNGNSNLIYFNYPDGNVEIIAVGKLFTSDVQPNGTAGAFGIQYFADETEAIDALNWAISQGHFSDDFQMTEPLYYDINSNSFKMQYTTKTMPDSSWYLLVSQNFFQIQVNSSTITEFSASTLELVKSTVLGTIVGIDGDDVLINTSSVQTLKMASAEDGALGILPLPMLGEEEDLGYHLLFPWRNGTVIDYYGLLINHNINIFEIEGSNYIILAGGNFYRPLTLAFPGEMVLAKN